MKILFLARLYHPNIGGVEKHLSEISKILLKEGHEVIVIAEQHDKSLKLKDLIAGVRVYRIPTGGSAFLKKFYIWKWIIMHAAFFIKADIIHVHDVFYWLYPILPIRLVKKIFITFHGYEGYPIKKRWIIARKIAEKLTCGNICVGKYIKKWYGILPDKITYGAVEVNNVKSLKSKKNSAYFVGRLDEQTSILAYSKAFHELRRQIVDFKFLVIGDGKYKNLVDSHATLIDASIPQVDQIMKYHFAFVSRYLTSFEAMALKKLVFVVADNPLKEDCFKLAPFGKWVIIVKNEKELINQVFYYLQHPYEERKRIEKAYSWVIKQNWEKMTSIYMNLWRK